MIVPHEEEAKAALAAMAAERMPPGAAARALPRHLVQVPYPDRDRLRTNGHLFFVEGFGDEFAVLATPQFYTRETGLEWERGDEVSLDGYIL